MTAPTPMYGANPYTGLYQVRQFDSWAGGGNTPWSNGTVFDTLANPPAAAIAAESNEEEFEEETTPTPGANDDEPTDTGVVQDPLYPDQTGGTGVSTP